jgi:iron complex outermembrane receptor protein
MDFEIGTLTMQYALQLNQRKEFDIRRSSQNDRPGLSLSLLTQSLDLSLDHHLGKWSGSVGLNGTFKDNDNELSTGILPDFQQGNVGLFLIERRAYNQWNIELGGRLEYQYLKVFAFNQQSELVKPDYHFNYGAAALGAAYRFSERLRVTNHLSYSVRPPHTSELFSIGLHHSAGAIEEGLLVEAGTVKADLKNVTNESSSKWISSFQWSLKKATVELSGHVNYFNDFVYLTPYDARLTIRGYFPVFRYDQSDVLFAGGEFTSHIELTQRVDYKLNAAYLYTENLSDDDRLPMIPPGRIEQYISYTMKSLKNWKNVFVRLGIQTFLKQHRNPATRYPSEVVASSGNEEGTFDFMPAPPGYSLLNVVLGGEFPWGNRKLSVTLSCDNLLNSEYRSFMNRLRYFTDEPGRNFSLRFSYQFHSHKH